MMSMSLLVMTVNNNGNKNKNKNKNNNNLNLNDTITTIAHHADGRYEKHCPFHSAKQVKIGEHQVAAVRFSLKNL
eukprot:g9514.t1